MVAARELRRAPPREAAALAPPVEVFLLVFYLAKLPSMRREPAPADAVCRFRAATFKALGHPSRLFMLETLAGGERCVCELQELVDLDLSTVSKHLTVLRKAGLVADERRGNRIYYRLCCPAVADLLAALGPPLDGIARRQARELAAAVDAG
jgi:ArsR family transcriptional regulator